MSDTTVLMVAPSRETYCTIDGTPYRSQTGTLIHVQPQHVAELKRRGFRQVPSDWSVKPEQTKETPPPEPADPKRLLRLQVATICGEED